MKGKKSLLKSALYLFCVTLFFNCKSTTNFTVVDVLVTNISVVDVVNNRILAKQDIGIKGDTIVFIEPHKERDARAYGTLVKGDEKYVIPSLWDMHGHPSEVNELKLYLATGVLGVRVMWGLPYHLRWKASIADGSLIGPDIVSAGKIMEGTPPPEFASVVDTVGRAMVDSPEDVVKAVAEHQRSGFDFIKVYNNMPETAYDKLIEIANRENIPVSGHVPFEVGLTKAMKSQKSIEHLRGFIQVLVPKDAPLQPGVDFRSRELAWEYVDGAKMDSLATATADSGVYNCPTFLVTDWLAPQDTIIERLNAPHMVYVKPEIKKAMLERQSLVPWFSNFKETDFEKINTLIAKKERLVKLLSEKGAPILAGTDNYGFNAAGFSLHDELGRLAGCGLDSYAVLRTASIEPARFFDKEDEEGSIDVGKRANMILLDKNPIERIANTKAIQAVIKDGLYYGRVQLDSILATCTEDKI